MLRDQDEPSTEPFDRVWEEQLTFVGSVSWSGGGLLLLALFRSGSSTCSSFLGRHNGAEELD